MYLLQETYSPSLCKLTYVQTAQKEGFMLNTRTHFLKPKLNTVLASLGLCPFRTRLLNVVYVMDVRVRYALTMERGEQGIRLTRSIYSSSTIKSQFKKLKRAFYLSGNSAVVVVVVVLVLVLVVVFLFRKSCTSTSASVNFLKKIAKEKIPCYYHFYLPHLCQRSSSLRIHTFAHVY